MKFHSTIVQVYLYGNWPVGFIKYFGFIFKIDFSQRLISWRIDTFRICYASRIFFIFVFVVLSRCICLFVVIRIVKIQDLQLLFITSDKAFMEILLGQKFFPNISSWSFLREEFVHFSWSMQSLHNHVWNSVHYAPVVCLTTFIFHLLCPNF